MFLNLLAYIAVQFIFSDSLIIQSFKGYLKKFKKL
jgi:hypothetical protein